MGPLVWLVWLKIHHAAPALAGFVFGGAGIGAVLGFLLFDLGFGMAASALALLVGLFSAAASQGGSRWIGRVALSPEFRREETPAWLRARCSGSRLRGRRGDLPFPVPALNAR